ncbi:sigma-70 family RNA polymerase sigma factor [Mucilaginibacter robiniae]|uniref:Sigma-70 family RNA polymerase sigma factor n=2 Tax=Mucilaginibacter robiniae TaxID=2728022 RepID=A0A7L5E4W3_9SPHI|nr:sigma-70 family RNA polymerase sigma factor [Mucilaginibacter robiniae]
MSLFRSKPHHQLIAGCKANERSAQEGLYKLFYADMLRLCYRYLKSDELAAEALNMGFLKVFQNINSFDQQKGELGTWIKTIIVRTCIDLNRKEAKFIEATDLAEDAHAAFIAPEVLNKLYVQDLVKAIRQLPTATQLVFNLSVIEGYNHQEIGEQLQISEGTSRWHLSQAKKLLRNMLQPANPSTNDPTVNPNEAL